MNILRVFHGDTLRKENEMRKIDNMNDTTDVNEEKRESPFYSFFDADLVFDIIKIVMEYQNVLNS